MTVTWNGQTITVTAIFDGIVVKLQPVISKTVKNEPISLPNSVGFAAKNSSISVGSSLSDITFQTVIEDTDQAWNGTIFTVPEGKGGIYEVFGHATFSSINSGNVAIVGVEVNGSLQNGGLLGRGVGVNGSLGGYGGAIRLRLNEGDTLNMVAYCANPTTLYNAGGQKGYCSFSAFKLR